MLAGSRSCVYLHGRVVAMPMTIETTHTAKLDDSPGWNITKDLIRNIGDNAFVKLRAYDMGLIRMVCHDACDLPKKNYKLTLAHCDGYKSLIGLRQAAVAELQRESPRLALGGSAPPLADAAQPVQKRRRQPLLRADQLQELRDNPQVIEFEIPQIGELPPMVIECVRPVHACDELTVKLCPDTLQHIVLYMRAMGITEDALLHRRQYRDPEATAGSWKRGSSGYVTKATGEDGRIKFKSANKCLQSSPAESPDSMPLTDDARSPFPVRRLGEDG